MFQNQIHRVVPLGVPIFKVPSVSGPQESAAGVKPMAVQVSDIYQAAVKRAVEDHELDKLFNPQYYDYQI